MLVTDDCNELESKRFLCCSNRHNSLNLYLQNRIYSGVGKLALAHESATEASNCARPDSQKMVSLEISGLPYVTH